MLNIVLPIAGRGSRFAVAGYGMPKPLIPIHGVPMISLVTENLRPACPHRFIFIAQREHLETTNLRHDLNLAAPDCGIVALDGITEGAACTVLAARDYIDSADPLMLANSDQYVDIQIDGYLAALEDGAAEGLVMTFPSNSPKWSFVKRDAEGRVVEVVEKQVVSNEATVGIYNFRAGASFVRAAERMIARNRRVNGEFYVAPAYNEMIEDGAEVITHNIGSNMYGLGVPADLEYFVGLPWTRERALLARSAMVATGVR